MPRGARPIEMKKGADRGIDGRIYFHEGTAETKQAILSVKGGHTDVLEEKEEGGRRKDEEGKIRPLLISIPSA
jgi:hypothetical protein